MLAALSAWRFNDGRLTHGLLAMALVAWAAPCAAASHALLVGVSGYPSLPEARRLRGPRNDVPLMRDVLQRAGMAAADIQVLADGVAGSVALPTRAAILAGLAALAQRARPGDWVVVYLSGHGSQQPQPPLPAGSSTYREPDGLDEIFLPHDIGRWDGRQGTVQGALVDDEIGLALAAIRARGARLWAIFDTCHAGDMARSWQGQRPGTQHRNVPADVLGVPAATAPEAGSRPRAPRLHAGRRASSLADSGLLPMAAGPGGVASVAVFYASQSDEPAAEEPLPEPFGAPPHLPVSAAPQKVYGYFTYLLAQELARRPGQSLQQLADSVARRYASRPYPTPLFQGDLALVPDFSKPGLTRPLAPGLVQ